MTRPRSHLYARTAQIVFLLAVTIGIEACRDGSVVNTPPPGPPPAAIVWERKNGTPTESILTISSNAFGMIFASGMSGELYRSTDLGLTWGTLPVGSGGGLIRSVAFSGTTLVAGNTEQGIFLSSDNGETWTGSDSGLADLRVNSLAALAGGHLYAGTSSGKLYRSTSSGALWTEQANVARSIIALCASVGGTVLLSAWDHGLYRFTEPAGALQSADAGMNDPYVMVLTAGANGEFYAGTFSSGAFRSGSQGASWQLLDGLPATAVSAIAALASSELLVSTAQGPFVSYDGGGAWVSADSGLSGAIASCFAETPSGRLFVGTDRGIFRAVVPPVHSPINALVQRP